MKRFAKQLLSLMMVLALSIGLSITAFAAVICPNCDEYCTYDIEYEQWGDKYHCIRGWCSECGEDIYQGTNAGVHDMVDGVCELCGYDDGSGDWDDTCYHDYTDIDWDGCEWEEYCEDCGEVLDSGIDHGSTYTEWDGCEWYEYCRDCGELLDYGNEHGDYTYTEWDGCEWYEYCDGCNELVDYGTDHGSYEYGDWEYYNSSRHRRLYGCEDCGEGSYEYSYHSTTSEYSQYSSTQHTVGSYCSACSSYIGSTSYESHDFSYGSWTNYSGSQHRRSVYYSDCGYSGYEYANHSLNYGSWTSTGSSQHKRTVSCSCGYSTTETASHNLTYGVWTNYSSSQHKRTISCSTCSYSTTEYASHTITNGEWTSISDAQHSRTGSCSCGYSGTETEDHELTYGEWEFYDEYEHIREVSCDCGYESTEIEPHTDPDDDGYCDDCDYLTSRFSVTVPAYLLLTVSEHGIVYSAADAVIINNSTGAVAVTSLTVTAENGWYIVPYTTEMADEKVDSRLIGFTVNHAETENYGITEQLSVYDWQIASNGSLPLVYSANVSAASAPIEEQVLTLVFVFDWAA